VHTHTTSIEKIPQTTFTYRSHSPLIGSHLEALFLPSERAQPSGLSVYVWPVKNRQRTCNTRKGNNLGTKTYLRVGLRSYAQLVFRFCWLYRIRLFTTRPKDPSKGVSRLENQPKGPLSAVSHFSTVLYFGGGAPLNFFLAMQAYEDLVSPNKLRSANTR
jgi:hypothetical protein